MINNRIEQLCNIRSSFASLSKVHQKIARFVVAHTDELRHLTITQLADKLEIDPSSITRFCQKQGFKGYSSFRFFMTHNLASSVPEDNDLIEPDDNVAAILTKSKRYCQRAIGEVLDLLDPNLVEQAAQKVFGAGTVHVYAQDGSMSSAKYAEFMFLQIGIPCYAQTERLRAMSASSILGQGDTVIAISFSGDAKIVIDAVENAKNRKATIIGITGFQDSILGRDADILLSYNARVPDDLRYLHMIYVCELSVISAIHAAVINKYHNELSLRIQNASLAQKLNRYGTLRSDK